MTVNMVLVGLTVLAFLLSMVIVGLMLRLPAAVTGEIIEKRYVEPTTQAVPNYLDMGITGMPTVYPIPERWILKLEDAAGNHGEVTVSQEVWDSYQVGDFYPKCPDASL